MESNMEAHMKTMARPKRTGENGPALPEIFSAHDTTFVAGHSPESQENIAPSDPTSTQSAANDTMQLTTTTITPVRPPTDLDNRTVTKNPRTRNQTVTVRSQTAQDIDSILEEIRKTEGLPDPLGEFRSRMQVLVSRLEKDYAQKVEQTKRDYKKEASQLAVTVASSRKEEDKARDTFRKIKTGGLDLSNLCRRPHVNDPTAINGGPDRALSPENLAEITKERDSLREEMKEQENSYFDLLKRFEKLRETCTTLKANEENLKKAAEEGARMYGELMAKYAHLTSHANEQLESASAEIDRMQREFEENTVGLRLKLKQKEVLVNSLQSKVTILENENVELRTISEDILRNVDCGDSHSEGGSEA
ncbi:cytochrome c oxidase subunit 2 [Aphelenchoides avenae]|nr:cytochrome c oxidase subunit 2 [Aphelenchus avenae]